MIVTLTPRTDFAPVPRVEIRIEETADWWGGYADLTGEDVLSGGSASSTGDLLDGGNASAMTFDVPLGTDKVTLWRRWHNRVEEVRGGIRRPFGAGLGIQDLEAGFNIESSYELQCLQGDIELARINLGRVILPWAGNPHDVLIQNPLEPHLHAVVKNLAGSWPALATNAPGELVATEGSAFPAAVGFGPRTGVQGMAIDFGAATREDAARVMATLGTQEHPQLQVWLIRPHAGFAPRVFFCWVGELIELDVNQRFGREWSRFQASVTEVRPPAPALVTATLTYSDLAAEFGTYSAIAAALPRYTDWSTAWQYAGAAG